jgi:serine/threonine protein kinase
MEDYLQLLSKGIVLDDRYELIDRLGVGGQAAVWRVRRTDGRSFEWAAKISLVPWESRSDVHSAAARRAFEKETEALKRIAGTRHIIALHDFCAGQLQLERDDGTVQDFFFQLAAMDHCPLGDMAKDRNMRTLAKLDPRRRVQFLHDAASGLLSLHRLEIIHCDIKPSNILVFQEPNVLVPKLSDFGATQQPFMGSSAGMGTPAYMAPEAAAGGVPTTKSDVFSLGATFHHLLTGSPLVNPDAEGMSREDQRTVYGEIYSHLDYSEYDLGTENEDFRPLLRDMLSHSPADRPSVAEVLDRLQELLVSIIRTEVTDTRTPSRVKMDAYRWNPACHYELGEKMYFFYLHNQEFDEWQRISRKLREKSVFSYSIHRIIGETDFILRGWFSTETLAKVRDVVRDFRSNRHKADEIEDLTVAEVLPAIKLPMAWTRAQATGEKRFAHWLREAVKDWTNGTQLRELEKLKLVVGKLERSGKKIRVFLRIELSNNKDDRHTKVFARQIADFFEGQVLLKRVSGPFFLYRMTNASTLIVEFRLPEFQAYASLVGELSRALVDMNTLPASSRFHTTTLFELDQAGMVESDDGRITDVLRVVQ